jgi:vancomycin resistance protein VanJ
MIVLLLIRWVGDRWWGVTVLLFLPRWLFLAPLPVLALASGLAGRPRHWILQAVVALVIAGPLMLISLPVHQLWARPVAGTRVRIMTFNQGAGRLDQERLIRIIEQERIDVICFQEGSPDRNPRLAAYLDGKGWYRDRKKHYLASRYPIVSEMTPPHENMLVDVPQPVLLFRARVRLSSGVEFGLASVHMPTLRFGFYRFLDRDVEGLKQHILWHEREMARLMGGLSEMNDGPSWSGATSISPRTMR